MKPRTLQKLGLGFVMASFVLAIAVYPTMPEQMIVHWRIGLDRALSLEYMTKDIVLFVAPVLSSVLFVLCLAGSSLAARTDADRFVRSLFAYSAAGVSMLLFGVEVAVIWLN